MKQTTFLFLFVFFVSPSFSQDTIIKNNSEKIIAKILEVSPTEVKYKKFDFQDGPTFSERKAEIKSVAYQNGNKEVFQPDQQKTPVSDNLDYDADNTNGTNKIVMWEAGKFRQKNVRLNENQVCKILKDTKDEKIVGLINRSRKARGMQLIGFGIFPLGIGGLMALSSLLGNEDEELLPVLVPVGVVCVGAAIACPIVSKKYRKKRANCISQAIEIYNQQY